MPRKKKNVPKKDQLIAPKFVSARGRDGAIWVDRQDGERVIRVSSSEIDVLKIRDGLEQGVQLNPTPNAIPCGRIPNQSRPYTQVVDSALSASVEVIESRDAEEAKDWRAFLRSYLCILLVLRDLISVRPLLFLVGPPGSGKSSIARTVGQILFGGEFRVTGFPAKQGDFDVVLGKVPYLALDNVESVPKWFCDRLSTLVTKGEFPQRILYEDHLILFLRPDIFISMSAVAPVWVRGDILDRSLVLRCDLPTGKRRLSDGEILEDILQVRDAAFGELIRLGKRALRLLQTQEPLQSRDRLVEFQTLGRAVAFAAGGEKEAMRFERAFSRARRNRHVLLCAMDIDVDALFQVLEEHGGSFSSTAVGWMLEIGQINQIQGRDKGSTMRDPLRAGNWLKTLKQKTSSLVKWTREPRRRGDPRRYRAEFLEGVQPVENLNKSRKKGK